MSKEEQLLRFSANLKNRLHLDIGHSLLDIGHSLLDIGHSSLDIGHSLLDIGHSLLDIGHSLLDIGHSCLDIGHSLLDIGHFFPHLCLSKSDYSPTHLLFLHEKSDIPPRAACICSSPHVCTT